VCGPARIWSETTLNDIMKACIILQNMIIEDERNPIGVQEGDDYEQVAESIPILPISFDLIIVLEIEKVILNFNRIS
jgi:hypothetical protein